MSSFHYFLFFFKDIDECSSLPEATTDIIPDDVGTVCLRILAMRFQIFLLCQYARYIF